MTGYDPPRKPYWTRVARTRRHIYYAPANDLPGVILFALIGIGGVAMLVVGLRHILKSASTTQDWILAVFGLVLVCVSIAQGLKLAGVRRP